MAQDERSRSANGSMAPTRDSAKLSEDISRVVNFLDTRRNAAGDRAAGLAHGLAEGLAQRRNELSQSIGGNAAVERERAVAEPLVNEAPAVIQPSSASTVRNPELAVRYHSFCSELDQLLDSFRSRVNSSKPVAH